MEVYGTVFKTLGIGLTTGLVSRLRIGSRRHPHDDTLFVDPLHGLAGGGD